MIFAKLYTVCHKSTSTAILFSKNDYLIIDLSDGIYQIC